MAGGWADTVDALIADGQVGRAAVSFLLEIVGMTPAQVDVLKAAPGTGDVLAIAAATLPREARILEDVDLLAAAHSITIPVQLLLGTQSPPWAGAITTVLAQALPHASTVSLVGQGHEAIDHAPEIITDALTRFFDEG